jgi:hypothetical protein
MLHPAVTAIRVFAVSTISPHPLVELNMIANTINGTLISALVHTVQSTLLIYLDILISSPADNFILYKHLNLGTTLSGTSSIDESPYEAIKVILIYCFLLII